MASCCCFDFRAEEGDLGGTKEGHCVCRLEMGGACCFGDGKGDGPGFENGSGSEGEERGAHCGVSFLGPEEEEVGWSKLRARRSRGIAIYSNVDVEVGK
jgi:hypothetical protein